jgi:microcystin degradation protein MlrC
MRIAIAGFMHESNTFSTQIADRPAFAAQSLTFGRALLDEWKEAHHEVGGFIEGVTARGHELLPLCMAWATPAGRVADAVFDEIADYLARALQQQRPDGLLLALHGAMVTESHLDGDGAFVTRLRQAVGPELPMVITLDLHGNISQQLIEQTTATVAYRTCPHVDQRSRGLQAADILERTCRGEIRPVQALAKPPVLVNIMVHDTSLDPLRSIMAQARAVEQKPGILAVSVLPGFAYADVPQMGPSIIVVADGDAALARAEADRLGSELWDQRARLNRPLPDAAAAVSEALQAGRPPVVLVDTGDNVGGGSAGDGTFILAELLQQHATDWVVPLFAPHEVQQCIATGVGNEIHLRVGGRTDRLHGNPVAVTGKVRLIHDGTYVEPEVRHGGKRVNHMGLTALVELPGQGWLVLNSLRHPPFSLGQLTCLGIRPERQRILVVKAAIAYKAAYAPVAGTIIEVDTPGLTAVNPRRFVYRHARRDMYGMQES